MEDTDGEWKLFIFLFSILSLDVLFKKQYERQPVKLIFKLSITLWFSSFYCPTGFGFTHNEKEDDKRDQDAAGEDAREFQAHCQSLSEAKLAALCTEVWPVLAMIGGVDSGLRAGGLCQHKPSGRRAVLLGVLKEGSSLAKLQWEEPDISVRYYKNTFTCLLTWSWSESLCICF